MKKTNKYYESKKLISNNNKKLGVNNYNSISRQNIKKEKIIKDLKLKGFNERQITDIFQTFISNTIDKDNFKKDEEKHQTFQIKDNSNITKLKKKNNKYLNIHNSNSRDNILNNNPILGKTEIIEIKKSKCNYLKIYLDSSFENNKNIEQIIKEKKNEKSKKFYIPHNDNTKKFNNPHLKSKIITISERKENIGNYLKKYNSQKGNRINIYTCNNNLLNNKKIIKKIDKEKNIINFKNNKKLVNYKSNDYRQINLNEKYINIKRSLDKNSDYRGFINIKSTSRKNAQNQNLKERNHRFKNQENKLIYKTQMNSASKINNDIKETRKSEINGIKNIKIKQNKKFINSNKKIENKTNEKNKNNNGNKIFNKINSEQNNKIEGEKNVKEKIENNNEILFQNINIKESFGDKYDNISQKIEIVDSEEINKNLENIDRINEKNKNMEITKYEEGINEVKENIDIKNVKITSLIKTKEKYELVEEAKNNNENEENIIIKEKINKEKNEKNATSKIKKIKKNNNNNLIRNIPLSSNRNNNIFTIRKQNTEEDEILAKKNNGIIEIKVNSLNTFCSYKKSKSLSRPISIENNNINNQNLRKSNSNHNFVNINLCKNKENSSIVYINRAKINTKENSYYNLINKIENDQNIISTNKIRSRQINKMNSNVPNNNNHLIYSSYNLSKDINNKINLEEEEKNKDNMNIYINQIKEYINGQYKGIMLNNKKEIKGIMIYKNGATYDGQWKNDKKNGKGIFISSYYYNCKNHIGMKYEGDFQDDKIEGYGIAIYSNGDKYEGEWKNNKQYGRGRVEYFGGAIYEGEWMNGKFEGIGIFYLKNGERFEGRFSESKYNGYGKYYYNNGNYLEGIFENDRPKGECLLHKTDGQINHIYH